MERPLIDLTPLRQANVPVFFIIGGPGSGKGTQCENIVKKYGFSHLSSGDLLREEVRRGSPRGAQLDRVMKAGELVALEIVLDLVKEEMLKKLALGVKGFLVDGYPRDIEQGERFESEIQPCKLAFFFDASEDTLIKRLLHRALKSGRVDDNLETIRARLKTFNSATTPVVEHYQKKRKLVKINAEQSIDSIFVEVCHQIDKCVSTSPPNLPCTQPPQPSQLRALFSMPLS